MFGAAGSMPYRPWGQLVHALDAIVGGNRPNHGANSVLSAGALLAIILALTRLVEARPAVFTSVLIVSADKSRVHPPVTQLAVGLADTILEFSPSALSA